VKERYLDGHEGVSDLTKITVTSVIQAASRVIEAGTRVIEAGTRELRLQSRELRP
jgi:hypothetical protein